MLRREEYKRPFYRASAAARRSLSARRVDADRGVSASPQRARRAAIKPAESARLW